MDVLNEEILHEICLVNGINSQHTAEELLSKKTLLILFSGLPYLISFSNFSFLTKLVVISQEITKIENLESCPNLTILWLCECKISKIENIDSCKLLTELYLYNNMITEIENLNENKKLNVLWLNDNYITSINGILNLSSLNELNLSGNKINTINSNINFLLNLKRLYISGNYIWNLCDIINLSALTSLSSLALNEPEYVKNPICENINLPLIIIYYFPNLQTLDHQEVNSIELKQAVKNVIKMKQNFYLMKFENYRTTIEYQIHFVKTIFDHLLSKICNHICNLDKLYQNLLINNFKTCKISLIFQKNNFTELEQLTKNLNNKIQDWENIYNNYFFEFHKICHVIQKEINLRQLLYELELQMCGYLEIKEIDAFSDCFSNCTNVLASKFCPHYSKSYGIVGIKILQIYKITNKSLGVKEATNITEDTNSDYIEKDEIMNNYFNNNNNNNNNTENELTSQEYLILPRSLDKEEEEIDGYLNIIRCGFQPQENGYILTDSLNCADNNNLNNILQDKLTSNFVSYNYASLILLIRVPSDSVCQSNLNELNNKLHFDNELNALKCNCVQDKKDVLFFDTSLLVPEFLIKYEYIMEKEYISHFHHLIYNSNNCFNYLNTFEQEFQPDFNLINQISSTLLKSNGVNLEVNKKSLQYLLDFNYSNMNNQHSLIINDFEIVGQINLEKFLNLTILVLTHCNLKYLPLFNGSKLTKLDLSYNQLSTLNHLPVMSKLSIFNLSYNLLNNLMQTIEIMAKSSQNLINLSLRGNCWIFSDDQICKYILSHFTQLIQFNDKPIKQLNCINENIQIDFPSIDTKLIQSCAIQCSQTNDTNNDDENYSYLTIYPLAHYYYFNNHFKYKKIKSTSVFQNFQLITSLCLEHANLHRIQNLDCLINLKFLSLNHNYISKIEGLDKCNKLIELSLEYNQIKQIKQMEHLKQLKYLFLGNNCIRIVKSNQFDSLISLNVLNLSSNKLEYIVNLNVCKSIQQLYLSNNNLNDIKNIFSLRNLNNLNILEFSNNNMIKLLENYRLCVIYYLKNLKALDGEEISLNEIYQARELFGGHLSLEYLMDRIELDCFDYLVDLDLPNCMLKCIDPLDSNQLSRLETINLEKNLLTSFGGLLFLKTLKVICLNDNHIESLFPRSIYLLTNNKSVENSDSRESKYLELYHSNKSIYPNLQVLHLAQNGIKSLTEFQFHRMSGLRSLFLQENELSTIHSLEGLTSLKELVLDYNKIKNLSKLSFLYNWTLQEIHLEHNRLRELNFLNNLENLTRLYVGGNRLNDLNELDSFAQNQRNLIEISLLDNPFSSKSIHRLILIYHISKIQCIDGYSVTSDERERAMAFYAEKLMYETINLNFIMSPILTMPQTNTTTHICSPNNQNQKVITIDPELALPELTIQKLTSSSSTYDTNPYLFQSNKDIYCVSSSLSQKTHWKGSKSTISVANNKMDLRLPHPSMLIKPTELHLTCKMSSVSINPNIKSKSNSNCLNKVLKPKCLKNSSLKSNATTKMKRKL